MGAISNSSENNNHRFARYLRVLAWHRKENAAISASSIAAAVGPRRNSKHRRRGLLAGSSGILGGDEDVTHRGEGKTTRYGIAQPAVKLRCAE